MRRLSLRGTGGLHKVLWLNEALPCPSGSRVLELSTLPSQCIHTQALFLGILGLDPGEPPGQGDLGHCLHSPGQASGPGGALASLGGCLQNPACCRPMHSGCQRSRASELRTPLEMLVFPWIVDEDRGGGTLELGSGGIGALRRGLQLPGKFVLQSSSTKKKSSAQD